MNLTTTAKRLQSAVKTAIKVIAKRVRYQVLTQFKIQSSKNGAFISATDMETYLTIKIADTKATDDELLINANIATQLIKKLDQGEIDIYSDTDRDVVISQGEGKAATLPTQNAGEFPEFPILNPYSVESMIVDSTEFIKAFKIVREFTSKDKTRQELTGVHMAEGRLWGADGHTCSYQDLTCVGDKPGAIFNPSLVDFLPTLCPNGGLISIDICGQWVSISTPSGGITQRLVEGKNLADFNVDLDTGENIFTLDRKEAIAALELAELCQSQGSKKHNAGVIWVSIKDGLNIISDQSECRVETTPISETVSTCPILINPSKLVAALGSTKSKTIKLQLCNSRSLPIFVYPENGATIGVMPIDYTSTKDFKTFFNDAIARLDTEMGSSQVEGQTEARPKPSENEEVDRRVDQHETVVKQIIDQNKPSTVNQSTPTPIASGTEVSKVVTAESLKSQYRTFKDAKQALGLKAVSWVKLAEKVNAQRHPINKSNSVESVVRQLKGKYGKLAAAKQVLGLKAVSWVKLANLYMNTTVA